MDAIQKDKFEKVVNMMLMEVPQTQIAKVCGMNDSDVSRLIQTDEFKEAFAARVNENAELHRDLNDGWDAIEKQAVGTVLERLMHSKDAEFALKAAVLANKANRRGSRVNQPIPTEIGAKVVIQLQQNFVQRAASEGLKSAPPPTIDAESAKIDKALPPTTVEKMLQTAGIMTENKGQNFSDLTDLIDNVFAPASSVVEGIAED